MLKIFDESASHPNEEFEGGRNIATDDYYIKRMEDGRDELHFTVQLSDPAYRLIEEETRIVETTEQQTYAVKTIDAGRKTADIGCQLDLDAWRAEMYLDYRSGLKTAYNIINAVRPGGWYVNGAESETKKREINMDGPTPLDIVLDAEDLFGYAVRFDTYARVAKIVVPGNRMQSRAFAVDSVNLDNAEYKGRSADLYTRLYPIGKDGLLISTVNGGLPYVKNNSYTRNIVSKVWVDERYTDAQSLMEDAQVKVDAASQPVRSWELDVVDLYALDAGQWNHLSMSMFDVILLIDRYRDKQYRVQIRQQRVYPHHPERNKIYVSTVADSVQRSVRRLAKIVNDRNSVFYQRLNAIIKEGL